MTGASQTPPLGVKLYTTLGCHLCEDAASLLQQMQHVWRAKGAQIDVIAVEIADDPLLVEAYGIRIPVIAVDTREIGWPFDLSQLAEFLGSPDA